MYPFEEEEEQEEEFGIGSGIFIDCELEDENDFLTTYDPSSSNYDTYTSMNDNKNNHQNNYHQFSSGVVMNRNVWEDFGLVLFL